MTSSLNLNKEILTKFEMGINTIDPAKGSIPITILGYGEISLVFQLQDEPDIAYKRLPIFDSEHQVKRHIEAYRKYQDDLLSQKIGLNIPAFGSEYVPKLDGTITLFLAQKKLDPVSVCHKLIHTRNSRELKNIIKIIMSELHKIFAFNRSQKSISVGIDAQISNWAVKDYKIDMQITPETEFYYLDTSTPMFRKNKKEAMEAELFLKSAPSFLRTILKYLFLQDVLDRYHDWRLVTIDLLANLFKEQRQDIIPSWINIANNYFMEEASEFQIKEIKKEEVIAYYKEDKQIWDIFQRARKFDRWLQTKAFRKKYEFYLPDEIKR